MNMNVPANYHSLEHFYDRPIINLSDQLSAHLSCLPPSARFGQNGFFSLNMFGIKEH